MAIQVSERSTNTAMNTPEEINQMAERTDVETIRELINWARTGLVDRESLVEVLALAAVASEHVLVVGPPGTAKSLAVRRFSTALNGKYFEYLLGRFTEPNEVFGPIDLRKLREGTVEVETAGMLPDAQIAFLDEVFLGSTAILNTLLGLLNERIFRRGRTSLHCDLRLCVGASNSLPNEPQLAAFADRFLIRMFVDPVADARLEDLLEDGWVAQTDTNPPLVTSPMQALERLSVQTAAVNLDMARPLIGGAIRRLRAAGITITDRRAVRTQRLIAAAAVLEGRTTANPQDLWPLPLVAPTLEAQSLAQEVLRDLLKDAHSMSLPHAAEELTRGPLARAERIKQHALALLGQPDLTNVEYRLKLEATLREIDASFAAEHLPPDLADTRSLLIMSLQPS
jgi:MoxR-like ATPase